MNDRVIRELVEDVADDVGRLRRGVPPGSSLEHALDRISGRLETIHSIVAPTAAELIVTVAPGDDGAIIEALRLVDGHAETFRQRMAAP